MTTAANVTQANTNVLTASLIPSAQSLGLPSSTSVPKTNAYAEDSVHLSDTALQYLQSSQTKATQNQNFVEQLVRAAAAGDSGALSLLTVI